MIKYLLSLPWVAITGHEIIEVSTCNIKRPPALKHWEMLNWFSVTTCQDLPCFLELFYKRLSQHWPDARPGVPWTCARWCCIVLQPGIMWIQIRISNENSSLLADPYLRCWKFLQIPNRFNKKKVLSGIFLFQERKKMISTCRIL